MVTFSVKYNHVIEVFAFHASFCCTYFHVVVSFLFFKKLIVWAILNTCDGEKTVNKFYRAKNAEPDPESTHISGHKNVPTNVA